jgi:hypothetical protein
MVLEFYDNSKIVGVSREYRIPDKAGGEVGRC